MMQSITEEVHFEHDPIESCQVLFRLAGKLYGARLSKQGSMKTRFEVYQGGEYSDLILMAIEGKHGPAPGRLLTLINDLAAEIIKQSHKTPGDSWQPMTD